MRMANTSDTVFGIVLILNQIIFFFIYLTFNERMTDVCQWLPDGSSTDMTIYNRDDGLIYVRRIMQYNLNVIAKHLSKESND